MSVLGMTLNCIHIFIVAGSFLYWSVLRPASQRFFIHSCIYLRILIISYLATLLGTNSLSVLMCRKAVNQSIIQLLDDSDHDVSVQGLWFWQSDELTLHGFTVGCQISTKHSSIRLRSWPSWFCSWVVSLSQLNKINIRTRLDTSSVWIHTYIQIYCTSWHLPG